MLEIFFNITLYYSTYHFFQDNNLVNSSKFFFSYISSMPCILNMHTDTIIPKQMSIQKSFHWKDLTANIPYWIKSSPSAITVCRKAKKLCIHWVKTGNGILRLHSQTMFVNTLTRSLQLQIGNDFHDAEWCWDKKKSLLCGASSGIIIFVIKHNYKQVVIDLAWWFF